MSFYLVTNSYTTFNVPSNYEKELVKIPLDLNENPSATIVLPPEVSTNSNPNPCFTDVLTRNAAIRASSTHKQLKMDLVEHIWQRFGPKET
jgi:hypothetical protein